MLKSSIQEAAIPTSQLKLTDSAFSTWLTGDHFKMFEAWGMLRYGSKKLLVY